MSGSGLRPALAATAAARLSYTLLGLRPPAGKHAWTRTNHRGEPITLLEGPAVAAGAVAGALIGNGAPGREEIAQAVAGLGAAAFGGYDDLAGDGSSKGFRGHLGALAKGELTTGAVKLGGIGATGLLAALIAGRRDEAAGGRRSVAGAGADIVIDAGLIAGLANLLNLFDLRPGRAVKVAAVTGSMLAALPGEAGPAAVAPVAASLALLPEDLGERSMLGDCGANAIGAMLGVAATRMPRPARLGLLAAVAGLTAASENVSFTKVIERTPALNWLDMLGRRPPAPAAGTDEASGAAAGGAADATGTDGAGAPGAREASARGASAPRAARTR